MRLWVLAAVAAFAMLLAGWDTGAAASALGGVAAEFALSDVQQGLVIGATLLGATFGAFFAGAVSQHFGPRRTLIGAGLLYAMAALASAAAPSYAVLLAARALLGVAFGATAINPIYVGEISPAAKRGALVSLAALYTAAGIILAYLMGGAVIAAGGSWRWMLASGAVPGLMTAIGMQRLPESPRRLAAAGRLDAARAALAFFNGPAGADAAAAGLAADAARAAQGLRPGWSALVRPEWRRLVLIGAGVTFFQQASGINAVLYFAPRIFEGHPAGPRSALLAATGISVINLLATLVATQLVDRAGRRALLLWGVSAMVLCLAALSAGFVLGAPTWAIGGLLCAFVTAYALSLGVVPWALLSEIFPLEIRERGVSVAVLTLWMTNLLVTATFPALSAGLGTAGVFLLFAVISGLGVIFILRLVPETKGRTLDQIQADIARAAVAVG